MQTKREEIIETKVVPSIPPDRVDSLRTRMLTFQADLEIIGYLRRYCVYPRNALSNFYIHEFLDKDEPFFHNHPWFFQTTILSGAYIERCITDHRGFGKEFDSVSAEGRTRVVLPQDFHYISKVKPNTWSLVKTGPVINPGWGFLMPREMRAGFDFVRFDEFKNSSTRETVARNGYTENEFIQ